MSTLEQQADKLLKKWAVRKAGMSGRDKAEVMREAGILTPIRRKAISEYEVPFSVVGFTSDADGYEDED